MATFTAQIEIQAPASVVFEWHHQPSALEWLIPPWAPVTVLWRQGSIHNDDETCLQLRPLAPIFPWLTIHWLARHEQYTSSDACYSFCDRQIRGPFATWLHRHSVIPLDKDHCQLVDTITYTLPLHGLSEPIIGFWVRQELARMFAYRQRVTRQQCEKLV
ncbi:MAG: SRPBCC family protein [Vampirovibrionales bacterium]